MADAVLNADFGRRGEGPQGPRVLGFFGRRLSLVGILVVNSLLGFITLGIYRFWARTRIRQFFWNSIDVEGDPLEYTGRGLELFVGFLIVVAVLVPVSSGYTVVSVFLEASAPNAVDAMNFLYFVLLLWLGQYAYFRARRYRLARTVWRGIRAGQDGSASSYAWLSFGYTVLSVITLGWATPWKTAELQKYEVQNARFGIENFRYNGKGSQLLRAWAPCGTLFTLAIVAAVALTFANLEELELMVLSFQDISLEALASEDPEAIAEILTLSGDASLRLAEIYAAVGVALAASIVFYFIYRITALRYMFNAANLAEVRFVAQFSAWRIVGNWFLFTVVNLLFAIALFSLIGVVSFYSVSSIEEELTEQNFQVIGTLVTIVAVVALFMLLPVIKFILFHYPVIRHVATTLELTDIASLERIVQSSKDDPRFGEGLAAALDFDVGGF